MHKIIFLSFFKTKRTTRGATRSTAGASRPGAYPASTATRATATKTTTTSSTRTRPTGATKTTTTSTTRTTRTTAAPSTSTVAHKPSVAEQKRAMRLNKGSKMNVPEYADEGAADDRVECRYCGRKFASDRIDKHESICASASKKRKKFDSKKQRIAGTEAAQFQRSANQKSKGRAQDTGRELIGGVPKYKVEHENLIAALRAARKMTAYEEAKAAGKKVGPPPEMPVMQELPDDRIQCPYCGRKFGEEQYERHIRFCSQNAPIPKVSTRGRRGAATTTRGRGTTAARRTVNHKY